MKMKIQGHQAQSYANISISPQHNSDQTRITKGDSKGKIWNGKSGKALNRGCYSCHVGSSSQREFKELRML
ncbi:hypothetical protein BVRB_9g213930 [Beta vulgaris subsp. vulgaris]|nr:hypothetical protein BVRB_9g213930 [Beta vulgaris subsp. vulgaris]